MTVTPDRTQFTDEPAFRRWLAATSDQFSAADRRRVEVYVRSMLPPLGAKSRQESLLESLDEFVDDGVIDDVSITIIGNRLCLCDTCTKTDAESALINRFKELDDWGREYDASTSPFFETHTLDSRMAGETARALVPPRICVALYCDGDLSGVFPCEMGDVLVSATDFVSTLAELSEDRQIVVES